MDIRDTTSRVEIHYGHQGYNKLSGDFEQLELRFIMVIIEIQKVERNKLWVLRIKQSEVKIQHVECRFIMDFMDKTSRVEIHYGY